MDPFAPINGISLERYADLGADISDCVNDPEAQARIVEQQGVSRADWEAAKQGWTARMQDMALMGRVAQAYMPLYQAALNKKRGSVSVTFEEFVAMAGAMKALGWERALATYGIDQGAWTQISSQWQNAMTQNPMQYGQAYGMGVEQEAMRIQQGGQPRPVNIQRSAGGSGMAGTGGAAPMPQVQSAAHAQQRMENQMMGAAVQANVNQYMAQAQAQAAAAYGQASQNMGMMGRGVMGMMGMGAIASGIGPGMGVMVQWSDGNRYPGSVMQVANGHVLVAFSNGQQQWVPEHAVAKQ